MILGTSRSVRVYAYPEPVDLRKGYDGLFGLVKQGLGRDPLSGDLFLFVNARRRGCKVPVWDGTGLCIFQNQPSSHCTSFTLRSASLASPFFPAFPPDRRRDSTDCTASRVGSVRGLQRGTDSHRTRERE